VALNYQTEDIPNLINAALFRQNGASGYVLKPEYMRNQNIQERLENSCRLKIRIISGQHLPKVDGNAEVVDPYVEIRVRNGVKVENHL